MKKSVLSWVVVLLLWQGLALLVDNTILIPAPIEVFLKMFDQLQDFSFWNHLGQTFFRILIAFVMSLLVSFILVVLKLKNKYLDNFINQLLMILRVVPTAAIILMALVWLTPHNSIILITLLVMIPLMVDLLQQQFDRIKKDYRDPIVIYGSSTMDNLLKVFIPLSLESFLTLCRSAVLLGLKVVVSSEVLVSIQVGLGRQLQYARFDLDMNRLFAITIWVILIAVGVTKVFDYLIDKSRY